MLGIAILTEPIGRTAAVMAVATGSAQMLVEMPRLSPRPRIVRLSILIGMQKKMASSALRGASYSG
ncbi:hypothetical protein GCM10028822_40870 [Hymenobacter terrigena]